MSVTLDPSRPVAVLYDASYLGLGHRVVTERSGIHRVVTHVARGLASREDVRLGFCAPYHASDTLEFRAGAPWAQRPPFVHAAWRQALRQPTQRAKRFLAATAGRRQFAWRGMRWLAGQTAARLDAVQNRLEPAVLTNYDVYHSPWSPVPEAVQRSPQIVPFLTIYDLIPVLFPQYFQPSMVEHFHAILRSIDARTRTLCISQSTKDDLCNHLQLDPEKVFVTPLAAGEKFKPCSDLARQQAVRAKYRIPDAPYLLMLNTLEPRKNCDFVIRAFARLLSQERLGDLHLVLVGNLGWRYDQVLAAAEGAQRHRDRLVFPGFVADDDLSALYSGALGFVYVPIYEGFGLPPLEAMQCGTPTITSNTSSLPEVVGDAGLTVSPTDEDALCDAMLRLVADASLRAQMSRRGLERARRFSWEHCVDATVAAYRTAVGS